MPLYDYQCSACGKVTEVRHGFSEMYAQPCAACGGGLTRVFNPAPILFKGSGFYVTDSRKGGESKAGKSDTDASAKSTDSTKSSDAAKKGESAA